MIYNVDRAAIKIKISKAVSNCWQILKLHMAFIKNTFLFLIVYVGSSIQGLNYFVYIPGVHNFFGDKSKTSYRDFWHQLDWNARTYSSIAGSFWSPRLSNKYINNLGFVNYNSWITLQCVIKQIFEVVRQILPVHIIRWRKIFSAYNWVRCKFYLHTKFFNLKWSK